MIQIWESEAIAMIKMNSEPARVHKFSLQICDRKIENLTDVGTKMPNSPKQGS